MSSKTAEEEEVDESSDTIFYIEDNDILKISDEAITNPVSFENLADESGDFFKRKISHVDSYKIDNPKSSAEIIWNACLSAVNDIDCIEIEVDVKDVYRNNITGIYEVKKIIFKSIWASKPGDDIWICCTVKSWEKLAPTISDILKGLRGKNKPGKISIRKMRYPLVICSVGNIFNVIRWDRSNTPRHLIVKSRTADYQDRAIEVIKDLIDELSLNLR